MSACSQCKASIGLIVSKCHNCGLDFDEFRAKQRKKANSWIKCGSLFAFCMIVLMAIYKFLLIPLALLATAVFLYCAVRRKSELIAQPVEIFTNKLDGKDFY